MLLQVALYYIIEIASRRIVTERNATHGERIRVGQTLGDVSFQFSRLATERHAPWSLLKDEEYVQCTRMYNMHLNLSIPWLKGVIEDFTPGVGNQQQQCHEVLNKLSVTS